MRATESTSVPSKSNSHVWGDRAPAPVTSVTPANPICVWERRTPHEKPTPRGRRCRPHPRPGRLRQLVLLAGLVDHHAVNAGNGGGSSSTPAPAGKTIAVTEKDFSITVAGAAGIKPGTYTFVVTNKGPSSHDLTVNGPGVPNQATPISGPGTQNLTVTLQNGTYDLFCSVPGHKALGMDTEAHGRLGRRLDRRRRDIQLQAAEARAAAAAGADLPRPRGLP